MSSSRRRIISTSSGPAGRDAQCRRGIASRPAAMVPVPLRSDTQPAIHLYAPQRFVAASAATYDFGFIKTARPFQGLPGVFRSRRPDRRGSAAGAVAPASAYRGLSLRQAARGHVGARQAARSVHAAFPLLQRRHAAGDMPEVRSGFGAIVPATSRQSASMPPGRRDIARAYVRPARRYLSRPPAQPIAACGSRAN